MRKNIFILSLCIFLFSILKLAGQEESLQKGNATISGVVMDGNLKAPIPFVTVILKSHDGTVLTGQITTQDGKFEIMEISPGDYVLEAKFVGFKDIQKQIVIDRESTKLDLGTLTMFDDVSVLQTVEVTAERSTIEQKVDRKVINIGKDLATSGPTAADLMVNLPSVDVDQDGNISLRGNENVLVLVDGKPTNQSAAQLLQQIPSASIKSIELITNPSAKYVPEGMSGIINVILHKNTNLGFNGSVRGGLTVGEELRSNVSMELNYRSKNLNFFFNYANSDGPTPTWGTIERLEENSNEVWFARNDRTSHLVKAGVDFDLSEKTILSAYTIANSFQNNAIRSTDILFPDSEMSNFGQAYASGINNVAFTYNFDVKHNFSSSSILEFEMDHNDLEGEEDADFEFYGAAFSVDQATESIKNDRSNTTFNIDYENRFGSGNKLEIGVEARIQRTDNMYATSNPNLTGGRYELSRDIYAAYFNYSQKLGKWSYQVGARFEEFDQASLFDSEEEELQQYNDLIRTIYPVAFLSYIPNSKTQQDQFNFSISRRVDRPNITQLNPMRAWSSARITNLGNPSLVPQFTNSVELNYTRQLNAGSITAGVFYRKIFDEITRFGFNDEENPGNILFSYDNYRDNAAYGFEVSGNYQITANWSFTSSLDIYSQTQRGVAQDEFREVQNTIYNLRTNHSYKVNKRLTVQLLASYRGGNTNLQYRTLSFYFVNAGARYDLFKKKGTLSVNFNDIFHTQRFAFEGERPVLQRGDYSWDSQTILISYGHKFGRGQRRATQRKKRDSNEKKNVGGF